MLFETRVQNREGKQLAHGHTASQLQVWNLNLASSSCTAPVTRARQLSKLPREEQSSAPRAAEASREWTASRTKLAGLPGLAHPGRGWVGRAGWPQSWVGRLTDQLRPCSRFREAPAGVCGLPGAGRCARLRSGWPHLDGGLQVVSPHLAAAPHLGPG